MKQSLTPVAPVPAEPLVAAPAAAPGNGTPLPCETAHDYTTIPAGDAAPPGNHGLPPVAQEALRAWLGVVAGQLGLDPGSFRVQIEDDTQWRIHRREADGLAAHGIIHLRAAAFDPLSRSSRELVAHEAAHVAQSRNRPQSAISAAAAETEAAAFAEAMSARHSAAPVTVFWPSNIPAANTDFASLKQTVSMSRAREILRIRDYLDGLWISDGDAFGVLEILSMFPPLTAAAIAANLTPTERSDLLYNFEPDHFNRYREQVLAVCCAMTTESEFERDDYDVLNEIRLADLSEFESLAVVHIVVTSPKCREAVTDPQRKARLAEIEAYAAGDQAAAWLSREAEIAAEAETAEVQRQENARADAANFQKIAERIRTELDRWFGGVPAETLLDEVAGLCLPYRDPAPHFAALAEALGKRTLDQFIKAIPAEQLYPSESRRKAFVYLVSTRPAFQNADIIETLMARRWWQGFQPVSSKNAFLAYLLVKAMPARARQAYLAADEGNKWGEIIDELPDNIRESPGFNLYDGGEEQKDRQSILAELTNPSIWKAAGRNRLDATIRMARAANEGRFVFEQSRTFRADLVPELSGLVRKYELYDEKLRPEYREEILRSNPWYEEGVIGKYVNFGRTMQMLAQYLFSDGVDLSIANALGTPPTKEDSLAVFVRGARAETISYDEKKEARQAKRLPPNVISYSNEHGLKDIHLSELRLAHLSLGGTTTIQASGARCHDLRVQLAYDSDTDRAGWLTATFGRLTLDDCVIARAGAMYSINSLTLDGFHLAIRDFSNWHSKSSAIEEGFAAMYNPRTARSVYLTLQKFDMMGFATSSGTSVERIEIDNLTIEAAPSANSYQEALQHSRVRLTERLNRERAAVHTDPAKQQSHSKRIQQLEKQIEAVAREIGVGKDRGSIVDIRSIKVSGVAGMVDEPLTLDDVHGQGRSVAAVVPLFADPTTIRNLVLGSDQAGAILGQNTGDDFRIDAAAIRNKNPLRITGSLPTAAQAEKDVQQFLDANANTRFGEAYESVRVELGIRMVYARKKEELEARGLEHLSASDRQRYSSIHSWLIWFEERRAAIIETLAMEGVNLNIAGDGNAELLAGTLTVRGLRTFQADGKPNLQIDAIDGERVRIAAALRGGLASYKEWRKAFENGALAAQNLTVKGIRHAGAQASIDQLQFLGDDTTPGLELRLDQGQASPGGASVWIKSHRLIAMGVSLPLQAKLLAAERERIGAIPESARSADEVKRLKAIDQMMADLKRIEQTKADAAVLAARAKTPRERQAAAKAQVQHEQSLRDWQHRLVIARLTVEELNLSIQGLGDLLDEDYSFDLERNPITITGHGRDQQWLKRATVAGLRLRSSTGAQVVADTIVAGPVSGSVKISKTGAELERFTVGSVSLQGVSYASGAVLVQAIGATRIEGIAITGAINTGNQRTIVDLKTVSLARIVADQLRYEDAEKKITVRSGELIQVNLRNFLAVMPEDPQEKSTFEGQLTVDAVKSLALHAAISGYQAEATLHAPQPRAAPAGQQAHAISVGFAKSGDFSVAVQGLSGVANVQKPGGKNNIHVEWKNLSGSVVKNGDTYSVRGLNGGSLTVSSMTWETGLATVTIGGSVALRNIQLDLDATMTPKKTKPGAALKPQPDPGLRPEEPEKELTKLFVRRLFVPELDVKDVRVAVAGSQEDRSKGVEGSPPKVLQLESAAVRGLLVTGMDVLNDQGKVDPRGKVEITDSLSVTNLRTTIGEAGRTSLLHATASLQMFGKDAKGPGRGGRELSATLLGPDGMILRLGRTDSLTLEGLFANSPADKAKGLKSSLTTMDRIRLEGITTGDLIVRPDEVSITDIDITGPVSATEVQWASENKYLRMESVSVVGAIRIPRVYAKFRQAPTGKIVGGVEQTRPELTEAGLAGVEIPKLITGRCHYTGPLDAKGGVKRVEINFPQATVEGIAIHNLTKNFIENTLQVNAIVKNASANDVAATLVHTVGEKVSEKKFLTNVKAGTLTADALFRTRNAGGKDEKTELDSGYFELTSLGLRQITGLFKETGKKDQLLGLGDRPMEADANKLRYDKDGLSVGSAAIRNVKYSDPNQGVTVDIAEIIVPQSIGIPNKGPITIPEGQIRQAHLLIDDVRQLGSGSNRSGGKPASDIHTQQFYDMLDKLNGKIEVQVFAPVFVFSAGYEWYLKQDVFRVKLGIKNGAFDYKQVFKDATWLRNDVVASLQMDAPYVVDLGSEAPYKDWEQSYLALEVAGYDVLSWTPSSPAERNQMAAGQVALKKILNYDKKPVTQKDRDVEEKNKQRAGQGLPPELQAGDVRPGDIELRQMTADLGLAGKTHLNLGQLGHIVLGGEGKDAITKLRAESLADDPGNTLRFSLEEANVGIEYLNLSGTKVHGAKEGNVEISINGVTGGSLTFADGKVMKPKRLEATITAASVKNLAVNLGE